jgi:hypothetical protein
VTEAEINARLQALEQQRNDALNQVAILFGQLTVVKAELVSAQEALKKLQRQADFPESAA